MSLREQGYGYYVSPDRQRAKWIHPSEKSVNGDYASWVDVTDFSDEDLAKLLADAS